MRNPFKIHSSHDPAFSLWQSAIHSTLLKKNGQGKLKTALAKGHRGIGATASHPYMIASAQVIAHFEENGNFDVPVPAVAAASSAAPVSSSFSAHAVSGAGAALQPAATPLAGVEGAVATALECAKLAAEIAWDEVFHPSKVQALKDELKGSTCDPFWAECLTEYGLYLASGQPQPYIRYTDINEFVIPNCFPDTATIVVIGDWGTGTNDALVVLQQIAKNFQPDVLLHVGDIYYSGLPSEDGNNFSSLINEVWPASSSNPKPPLIFTMDGNHDRYPGAYGGYYQLIAGLNHAAALPQPNSYFALRNNFWQLVAMDTGYHDTSPFTVNSNLTYLDPKEIAWHLDKIKNNGTGVDTGVNPSGVRGTVLLSHHQLMSFTGLGKNEQNQYPAINPNLASALSPVFNLIDFWLWGHEHDLCIFDSYSMGPGQPLPPGRCVGASAIPIFVEDRPAPLAALVPPPGESGPPKIIDGTALGDNGTVLNHAYAVIKLNNAALSIEYYQLDSIDATPGDPPPLTPVPYKDEVTAPRAAKAAAAGAPSA